MAQQTTAVGDCPDDTSVTRCASQGERAQGRKTAEGFRQDLRGQLLGSRQVQTPQILATCSNVGTEGGVDQTGTPFQRQATELGDQQEVEGCPGHLLPGAQQPHQLLNQLARYIESNRQKDR